MNKIGLIVGDGTGKELAQGFNKICSKLSTVYKIPVEIIEHKHKFNTYNGIKKFDENTIRGLINNDLLELSKAFSNFNAVGCKTVFRTAINAESLYLFRKHLKGVKVFSLPYNGYKITMVRDMMQGFYCNENYSINSDEIKFESTFSKDNFKLISEFVKNIISKEYSDKPDVWFLYKHHLFGASIQNWISFDFPDAKIYQPDTGIDQIFKYFKNSDRNLVLVTGNEIGDFLYETLILHLEMGNKNTMYSKNIYLSQEFSGITEYQTVHGSVDDLAGTGLLNPIAMIRAAAAIFEYEFGIKNMESIMNTYILSLEKKDIKLKDTGGEYPTDIFINELCKLIS